MNWNLEATITSMAQSELNKSQVIFILFSIIFALLFVTKFKGKNKLNLELIEGIVYKSRDFNL